MRAIGIFFAITFYLGNCQLFAGGNSAEVQKKPVSICQTLLDYLGSTGRGHLVNAFTREQKRYPVAFSSRDGRAVVVKWLELENEQVFIFDPDGVRNFLRTNRGIEDLRRNGLAVDWLSSLPSSLKILDLGTGFGVLVRDLRALGKDAYGIDIALDPKQKDEPYFFEASIFDTGFKPESFDLLISTYSVFSNAYRKQLSRDFSPWSEPARILRPGGMIALDSRTTSLEDLRLKGSPFDIVPSAYGASTRWLFLRKRP